MTTQPPPSYDEDADSWAEAHGDNAALLIMLASGALFLICIIAAQC